MRCAERKKESDREIAERDVAGTSVWPVEAKELRQTLLPTFHSGPRDYDRQLEIPVKCSRSHCEILMSTLGAAYARAECRKQRLSGGKYLWCDVTKATAAVDR